MGRARTDFFVGVEGAADRKTLEILRACKLAGPVGGEDASLAVRAPRTVRVVAVDRERALGGRAVREDGVEVAVHENVDMVGIRLIPRDEAVTHFGAEVDELGREADGVEVALHDFGGAGNARRVVRAAVEVDERSKILQIIVKECHFCFLSS